MREKQESLLREAQDRLQQLEVERQAANAELQVGGAGCGRGRGRGVIGGGAVMCCMINVTTTFMPENTVVERNKDLR